MSAADARYRNVRRPVVDGRKVCITCGRTLKADAFYVAYRQDGRIQLEDRCKRCALAAKKRRGLSRRMERRP